MDYERFQIVTFLMLASAFVGLWQFASMSEYNLEIVRQIVAMLAPMSAVFAAICYGASKLDSEQVGNYFMDDQPKEPTKDKFWPFGDLYGPETKDDEKKDS